MNPRVLLAIGSLAVLLIVASVVLIVLGRRDRAARYKRNSR